MHGIKIPLQDFAPKMQGGAYARGGAYLRDTTVHSFSPNYDLPFCVKSGERRLPFIRISCVHVISLFLAHSQSAGRNPQFRSIVFLLVQHGV